MERFRLIEILLAEMVVYLLLWLWDDYLATLLSFLFGVIFLLILLVSVMVEWIERSKVPAWYYRFMIISILAPLFAALLYVFFNEGLSWVK